MHTHHKDKRPSVYTTTMSEYDISLASKDLDFFLQANWTTIDSMAVEGMVADYVDAVKCLALTNQQLVLLKRKATFVDDHMRRMSMYLYEHRCNVVKQTPDQALTTYQFVLQFDWRRFDIMFGFFNMSDQPIELAGWFGCDHAHYMTAPPRQFVPFLEGKYPYIQSTGFASSQRVYCSTNPDNLFLITGLLTGDVRRRFLVDFRMWNTPNTMTGTLFVGDTDTMLHYYRKTSPEAEILASPKTHLSLPDLNVVQRKVDAAFTIQRVWKDRSSDPKYTYCRNYQTRKFHELGEFAT